MSEGAYRDVVRRVVGLLQDRDPFTGVEVGVADGKTAEVLLRAYPTLRLHLVDPWCGDLPSDNRYVLSGDGQARFSQVQKDDQWRGCLDRLAFAEDRAMFVRAWSVASAGATDAESMDFVFVDAEHTEDAVMEDSSAWWRPLKRGGLMLWHDYGNPHHVGVKVAVDRFAKALGALLHNQGTVAWTVKA